MGERVDVTVLRNGKEKTFTVNLGELPSQQAKAEGGEESEESWGLTVANLSPDIARRFQLEGDQRGIVVTDVNSDSPADLAGIQPGDVIEEVNRQPIESVADFAKAMAEAKDQDTLLLLVRRGETSTFFALRKAE